MLTFPFSGKVQLLKSGGFSIEAGRKLAGNKKPLTNYFVSG